jgi:hypothetical protein
MHKPPRAYSRRSSELVFFHRALRRQTNLASDLRARDTVQSIWRHCVAREGARRAAAPSPSIPPARVILARAQPLSHRFAAVKDGPTNHSTRRSDPQCVPARQRSLRGLQLANQFFGLKIFICDDRWSRRAIVSSVRNFLCAVHGRRLTYSSTPVYVDVLSEVNRGRFLMEKTNAYAGVRRRCEFCPPNCARSFRDVK